MSKKYDIKNQIITVNTFVYQMLFIYHIDYIFKLNNIIYKDDKKSHHVKYSSYGVTKWKITTEKMLIIHIKKVIDYLNKNLDLNELEKDWKKEKNINSKKYLKWIVENLKKD